MLLDNLSPSQTLYRYMLQHCSTGRLAIVTAYYSVRALARFYEDIFRHKNIEVRIVIGNTLQVDDEMSDFALDLTAEGGALEGFLQTLNARSAIAFLKQQQVLVRSLQQFCHAKLYLHEGKDSKFYVLGSANFTSAGWGLSENANLELSRAGTSQEPDFLSLKDWFKARWANAYEHIQRPKLAQVSVKEELIRRLEQLFTKYSPADIYHRVLWELFGDELAIFAREDLQERLQKLSETKIYQALYEFQQRGVWSLIRMIQKQGGAILADAVGLGKTWQALATMKFFQQQGYEVLVLCPKRLEHNWQQYNAGRAHQFAADKLRFYLRRHSDLQANRFDTYTDAPLAYFQQNERLLVVIDESHNLRNDKSERYRYLCEHILQRNADVRVLLLSATPINNHLLDVRNQFKLIACGRDAGFASRPAAVDSLEALFANAQKQFTLWQRARSQEPNSIENLIQQLDKLRNFTDNFLVARTRKMIGLDVQFPQKLPPAAPPPPYSTADGSPFDELLTQLEQLDLTAYRAAHYTQAPREKVAPMHDEKQRQVFLVRMMFTLLVKRLESSWYALGKTIKNIKEHHENALAKIIRFREQPSADEYIDSISTDNLDEEEQTEADNASAFTLGKKQPIALADISDIKGFQEDLQADCERLKALSQHLERLKDSPDNKLQSLLEIIRQRAGMPHERDKKIIVFTTYADTAHYLYEQLRKAGIEKIACITGQHSYDSYEHQYSGNFDLALKRFAPYTKVFLPLRSPLQFEQWAAQEQAQKMPLFREVLSRPLHILIATDCLSEGQNLQDCGCVVNYDIHWNPVRLIQRMGRIDRIGSPHSQIVGFNFWPAESYEKLLALKNRVQKRMAIMALVGTETLPTDANIQNEIEQHPWLSQQTEKMLERLNSTWEEVETGAETIGLDDLSKEEYRQELLQWLKNKQKTLEKMPLGTYSGCLMLPETPLLEQAPAEAPALLMLLGYPKKTKKSDRYTRTQLAYIDQTGKQHSANERALLALLKKHKNQARFIAEDTLDASNKAYIEHCQQLLRQWLQAQQQDTRQQLGALNNLFSNFSGQAPQADAELQPQNLDLVAWLVLAKEV